MSSKRQRLWLVSELYYPETGTAAHLLSQIAEGLVPDFDVKVLCGRPGMLDTSSFAPGHEHRNGVEIFRRQGLRLRGAGLLGRAANAVIFSLAIMSFAITRLRRGDIVLVATNPPTLPLVMGPVARVRGCTASLLVHDVYPEVLVAAGALHRDSTLYRALLAIFGVAYRCFDRFIVLGHDMAELVREKIRLKHPRIEVVQNWADSDIFPSSGGQNPFRERTALDGKFVVQFSGNFGRTHDLGILIEAARLLAQDDRIAFMLVGNFSGLHLDPQSSNVILLERQPRDALREMLTSADVSFISFVDGMLGLSVPSRMYNVMAAGVPIIASADPRSELAREISSSECGWVLEFRTAEELASLITRLASEAGRDEVRKMGLNARKTALDLYQQRSAIEKYRLALS